MTIQGILEDLETIHEAEGITTGTSNQTLKVDNPEEETLTETDPRTQDSQETHSLKVLKFQEVVKTSPIR